MLHCIFDALTCKLRWRDSVGMTLRMGSGTTRTLGLLFTRHPFSMSQSAPSRYRPEMKQPGWNNRNHYVSCVVVNDPVCIVTFSWSLGDFLLTAVLGHLCVQCGKIKRPTIFPASRLDQCSQVGFWDMQPGQPHDLRLPLIHLQDTGSVF